MSNDDVPERLGAVERQRALQQGVAPVTPRQARQRRHAANRGGIHLWEFILRLLLEKKYNPRVIRWLDREKGEFRIVSREQIAKLWSELKNDPRVTSAKVLGAIRYYCKRDIFHKIEGRRHAYMFGDKATGWQL